MVRTLGWVTHIGQSNKLHTQKYYASLSSFRGSLNLRPINKHDFQGQ